MLAFRDSREGGVSGLRVDAAFTDSSVDLQGLREDAAEVLTGLEEAVGVPLARLTQVHGADVVVVDRPVPRGQVPHGDALVTTTRGLGLMVRAADCVPLLLADADAGVIGAVHAGRQGMVLGIVVRALEVMQDHGATHVVGWLGPRVCGSCYEVPERMRAEVSAAVPEAHADTSWGTPALDIGAGVRAQLQRAGVEVLDVDRCTVEDTGLHSYRRDGAAAGRHAGLVWLS